MWDMTGYYIDLLRVGIAIFNRYVRAMRMPKAVRLTLSH